MDDIIYKDSEDIITNLGKLNHRFAGKSVLLSGAGGFLGTQFCHYFVALNDSDILKDPVRLFAMDNLLRGEPLWIKTFCQKKNMSFLQRDIIAPLDMEQNYDFIIHAASIASPIYYRQYPIQTMDANVTGLRRLLDFTLDHPVESMLFFSSSEVYGDPEPACIPTPEHYPGRVSCTGPRACYDESKRYGETLCVNFHRIHKTPVKIVRPFNNYGPGLKVTDKRVIPDFFRDVLAGRDIIMFSDGNPTRTFCYISDAITGYLLALLSQENGESFNIGTDQPEISVRDLAELVVKITGKSVSVVCEKSKDVDYLKDNPNRRCPDISKAIQKLGYEPKISLEKGLSRLHQWYIANSDACEG